jgi:hypothetical protein
MKQISTVLTLAICAASCGGSAPMAPSLASSPAATVSQQISSSQPLATATEFVGRFDLDVGTATISAAESAPAQLTAFVVGAQVTLTWVSNGPNPVSFVIEAGSAPGAADIAVVDIGTFTTTFSATAPAGTYHIRVRARDASGLSAPSNEVTVVVTAAQGITFTAQQNHQAQVGAAFIHSFCKPDLTSTVQSCSNPTNPSGGTAPYTFRLGSGVGFPPFGLSLASNGVLSGTPTVAGERTFSVCAVDLAANSRCQEVTVTVADAAPCIPPAAPAGLTGSVSGSTVTLNWTGSNGASSYVIEAGSSSGASNLVVTETAGTSLVAPAPNGTYYVRVRAKAACGATSGPSNETSVVVGGTVPPPPGVPTLAPTAFDFGDQGGCPGGSVSGAISVTAGANVTWKVSHFGSSFVSWAMLTLGRTAGSGSGTIPFTITWPPQRNTSRTFTCADVFRFKYGDTIQVTFSSNHVLSSRITYTYLSPY